MQLRIQRAKTRIQNHSVRERFFEVLPGQYFDKETNLHYNYFRDYDPAIVVWERRSRKSRLSITAFVTKRVHA